MRECSYKIASSCSQNAFCKDELLRKKLEILLMWKTEKLLHSLHVSPTNLKVWQCTFSVLKNLICSRFNEISQLFLSSKIKLKFLYLFIFNYLRPRICMRAKCYFLLFLALVVIHIETKFFHDLRLLSSQPFCTTRSLCYYHKLAVALKWSVL